MYMHMHAAAVDHHHSAQLRVQYTSSTKASSSSANAHFILSFASAQGSLHFSMPAGPLPSVCGVRPELLGAGAWGGAMWEGRGRRRWRRLRCCRFGFLF